MPCNIPTRSLDHGSYGKAFATAGRYLNHTSWAPFDLVLVIAILMLIPLTVPDPVLMVALINLISFLLGITQRQCVKEPMTIRVKRYQATIWLMARGVRGAEPYG